MVAMRNSSLGSFQNTESMKAELMCVIEHYPSLKDKLVSRFRESEDFQMLCNDYFLCLKSLNQWEMAVERSTSSVTNAVWGDFTDALSFQTLQMQKKSPLRDAMACWLSR